MLQCHVDLRVWSYPNVLIYSKFHQNPFTGFGDPGGRRLPIPITIHWAWHNRTVGITGVGIAVGYVPNTKSPRPRPTSIPSGVLVHPAVWPQRTLPESCGPCPFRGGELGPHLRQSRLGCLATTEIGRKLGALPCFAGRGTGSPSSTLWPGPRPTLAITEQIWAEN